MNLLHLKLKNGNDLLAQEQVGANDDVIVIVSPIEIQISPEYGMFAKSWSHLSSTNTFEIKKTDILFVYPASEKGYKYYEEFVTEHMSSKVHDEPLIDDDEVSELEEMFNLIIESKNSIKH